MEETHTFVWCWWKVTSYGEVEDIGICDLFPGFINIFFSVDCLNNRAGRQSLPKHNLNHLWTEHLEKNRMNQIFQVSFTLIRKSIKKPEIYRGKEVKTRPHLKKKLSSSGILKRLPILLKNSIDFPCNELILMVSIEDTEYYPYPLNESWWGREQRALLTQPEVRIWAWEKLIKGE